MRSTAYKKQETLNRWSLTQQKLRFFTCVAPHTKSKGLPDRRSPTQQKLMIFIRVAPRTKSKGAPDQRLTHLLLLSAHASLCTKSKGLYRYVLQMYYFINQVFKSFYSSAGIIIDGLALH
jgi:hypothetical protein